MNPSPPESAAVFARRCSTAVLVAMIVPTILGSVGCGQLLHRLTSPVPQTFLPNPAQLPPGDPEFIWLQVVDVVDDYFRIFREQPLQNSGEVVLEGRIETAYRTGGTVLEPWRRDSTSGFERLQSTLQSIRRRATVVVRPQPGGYTVEVRVDKDLEDVDRSQYASDAAASTRHDGTIVRGPSLRDNRPTTLGWIPLGRDTSLEQQMLQDILGRVTQPDRRRLLHHDR